MIDDIIKLEHSVPLALVLVGALMGTRTKNWVDTQTLTHTEKNTHTYRAMPAHYGFSPFLLYYWKSTYAHVSLCLSS